MSPPLSVKQKDNNNNRQDDNKGHEAKNKNNWTDDRIKITGSEFKNSKM
jgi:hypothetical protein